MADRGFKYVSSGTLTGTVNDVEAARKYLTEDDMTKHMDDHLAPAVIDIRWDLKEDGRSYEVIALACKELEPYEMDQLAMWVNGQNSDGLGEGFEQQDFATDPDYEEPDYDEDEYLDGADQLGMVSFDWKTNPSKFVKVERF